MVEAVGMPNHRFLVAVQWYAKRFFAGETSQRLFTAFVDECRIDR